MKNLDNYNTASLKVFGKLALGMLKWIAIAILVGLISGLVGTLFHALLNNAAEIYNGNRWITLLLPVAGLIIVFIYRCLEMEDDKGTNLVLNSVRSGERLSIKMAFLIFSSTIITHLFGGSAGREGAALQIGGSLAAQTGRFLKLDKKDMSIITLCGMSAGFSALFGTPLTAAVFAMEVVSVGIMQYSAMVPCIIAALVGASVSTFFGIENTYFIVNGIPELTVISSLQTAGTAVACAVISIVFCVSLHWAQKLFQKFLPNQYARIAVGGAIVVALTFIMGTTAYNGAGMPVILNAFAGKSRPEAFLLKIIFTAITLGAGFKGGEIVPTLFVGATFGNFFAQIIGLNPSFGAAVGLAAIFCGVTNCPLASLFLAIELFGIEGLPFYGIAIAISYMMSGYEGLYSGQKIFYSKLKPTMIDRNTGNWHD